MCVIEVLVRNLLAHEEVFAEELHFKIEFENLSLPTHRQSVGGILEGKINISLCSSIMQAFTGEQFNGP